MKIWIINHYAIPPSMGGLVRHYYFSKYLQEKGHEVRIFTSSKIHNADINMITDKGNFLVKEVDGIEYTFVRTSDYKGNGADRVINMLQFPLRIWKIYGEFEKPDIIYTSSPDLLTAMSAVLLAKWMGVQKVVEIRDLWPESLVDYAGMSRKSPIIWGLYQVERWLYRNGDRLIFTIAGGKRYIREKGWTRGIDPRKINHINNGVDLREFDYNKERFQIQDEDLENEDIFKVVYTGSIRKVYDLQSVVRCAAGLQGIEPRIKFLIWGDGTEKEGLERECRRLGVTNLTFKGRVEKKYIPYILSRADVNLMHWKQTELAKYGCSLNKLFEYLAAGRLILSDVRNGYDLLDRYHCGVVSEGQGRDELQKAILKCFYMTEQERQKYLTNMDQCARRYDYKVLASRLERILKDMVR